MNHGPPELPPAVLDKAEILTHFAEVADELATRDLTCSLVAVGGSYMALHELPYVQQIKELAVGGTS
jgi:hypothetical protein